MTVKKVTVKKIAKKEAKVEVGKEKNREGTKAVDMLVSFGLTPYESKVYVYLLSRGGEVGGSKIAIGTGLHRQYVYSALPKLLSLNLVEEVSHGKLSKYKAYAPQEIEKIAKKRVFEAESIVKELQTFSKVGYEQDFEMYVGAIVIQNYEYNWLEEVRERQCQYIIGGNTHGFADMMGETLGEYLAHERRKHIITYYIGGNNEKEFYEPYVDSHSNLKMKFLNRFPKNIVSHMVIRKDAVLFYSFLKPALLYVIKSEVLAKNYEDFFMMLWEME